MTRNKLSLLGATAFALVLARPTSSIAGEPQNDSPPFGFGPSNTSFQGNADYFTTVATGVEFGSNYAITPSGDVDYYIASCGGPPTNVGTVKEIKLAFTHAKGDVDLKVYATDGALLGSSVSTTDTELVSVAGQKRGAVVIKVYGYLGATNPTYKVHLSCQF